MHIFRIRINYKTLVQTVFTVQEMIVEGKTEVLEMTVLKRITRKMKIDREERKC